MTKPGELMTRKSWSALIDELENTMRLWDVDRDDCILPQKRGSDRDGEVLFRYVLNGDWQDVRCRALTPGRDPLASERNLAGVVQIIDAMRKADQRGIGKDLADASRALLPPIDQREPHDVLGVAPNASDGEIKAAWRRRVRETHPDNSPEKRAEYDAVMAAGQELGATT